MSAEVINLDDHRPHVTIMDLEGNAHVVPVSYFEDFVKGGVDIPEDMLPVMRKVVDEWLRTLQEHENMDNAI